MNRQNGQALVEFSVISIVIFMLIVAIADGARAVYASQTLAEAVREGAHTAQLEKATDAQIRTAINSHTGILGNLGATTTISPTPSRTPGATVTLTSTYQFRMAVPLLNQIGPINMTSSATVTVE